MGMGLNGLFVFGILFDKFI